LIGRKASIEAHNAILEHSHSDQITWIHQVLHKLLTTKY